MHCKKRVIVALLATVLVLSMVAGCGKKEEEETSSKAGFTIDSRVITDKESAERAAREAANAPPPVSFTLEYQGGFVFPNGKAGTIGTGNVSNSEPNIYPMFITLTLDGEEIVRTGLLPVGSVLETFELTKDVKPGEHSVTMNYHAVDEAKQEEVSASVGLSMNLTVVA